jgi:hypothetical protein
VGDERVEVTHQTIRNASLSEIHGDSHFLPLRLEPAAELEVVSLRSSFSSSSMRLS